MNGMEKTIECKKTIIPIMHCFDNNYVIPAAVSFFSMLKNADEEYIYKLYVLHSDITVQNQQKLMQIVQQFPNATLEFINMAHRFDDIWKKLQFMGHYSKELLYKLLVSSIFPQYEKIIITDVDVAFLGDISPSYFSFDVDEKIYFAGVHQIAPKESWLENYYQNYIEHFGQESLKELKVCGGYLVANLKQLRQNNMEKVFIDYLTKNAYKLLQPEQDVINFCCSQDEIKHLPLKYIVCSYQYDLFHDRENMPEDPFYSKEEIIDSMDAPVQLHYATGIKPWDHIDSTKADIWYFYLAQTNMFEDYAMQRIAMKDCNSEYIDNAVIRKGNTENHSPMTVSVLCCTYNHEKFIDKTLKAIVNQKVDFPFEVIVADDCSLDRTQEIIRDYYKKYPNLIKPILRKKNVGIGENYYDALCKVEGKYLAICDGDDQWLDPLKLKKQVDFLENHTDYNICCSACIKHYEDTGKDVLFRPEEYIAGAVGCKEYYSFKDLLYCRFIASSTVMLRWQLRNNVPQFLRKYNVIDFTLNLMHAAGGKIKLFQDEVFARYNIHSSGITTTNNDKVEQETFCIIYEVNQFLDYKMINIVKQYIKDYKAYMQWIYETEKLKIDKSAGNIDEEERIRNELELIEKRQVFGKIVEFCCVLYRECVPEVLKRVWRLFKKLLILLYRECVPNIVKRGYRKIKYTLVKER